MQQYSHLSESFCSSIRNKPYFYLFVIVMFREIFSKPVFRTCNQNCMKQFTSSITLLLILLYRNLFHNNFRYLDYWLNKTILWKSSLRIFISQHVFILSVGFVFFLWVYNLSLAIAIITMSYISCSIILTCQVT